MKTQIILSKGWIVLAEYDFLITLCKGDCVEMTDGIEYYVDCKILDISKNTIQILVKL